VQREVQHGEVAAALAVVDGEGHFEAGHAAVDHVETDRVAAGDVDPATVNQNSHLADLDFDLVGLDLEGLGLEGQLNMGFEDCSQLEVLDLEVDLVVEDLVEDHCSRLSEGKEMHHESHLDLLGYRLDHRLEKGHPRAAVAGAEVAVRNRIGLIVADCNLMVEDREVEEEAGSYR
jgi:hypothetical protein